MSSVVVKLLLVCSGGALGTAARYLVNMGAARFIGAGFPYGTWTVNVLGCFLLGFLAQTFTPSDAASANLRLFLTTGFTGGFTTYSAFNQEALDFARDGAWAKCALYVVATLLLCALSGILGFTVARAVIA